MSNGNKWQYDELYLSPNQSTFLAYVAKKGSISTGELQHWKQNTAAACWRRELIAIKKGEVTLTAKGIEARRVQTHADAQRSRTMYDAPFARALRDVVGVARRLRVVNAKRKAA